MRSSVERSGFWYGYGEIENILKTAGFILFFLKKIAHSPAKFQKMAEKVGFRVGRCKILCFQPPDRTALTVPLRIETPLLRMDCLRAGTGNALSCNG